MAKELNRDRQRIDRAQRPLGTFDDLDTFPMKRSILPLLFAFSLTASAQDWALFPLGQHSYFADSSQTSVAVDLSLMDSVRIDGMETTLYFKRKLGLDRIGACREGIAQQLAWMTSFFAMDSLVERNDTVFFSSVCSVTPFYFLPRAVVGQSWTILSTCSNNSYDQITVTCTGIEQSIFLGLTDSVKTFALAANGTDVGQTPINEFQFSLSKEHGLIEFVPFALFLYHPAYTDYRSFRLIGFESAGTVHGYRQPAFEDYFHLSPGDITLWRSVNDPDDFTQPATISFQRDSITGSEITPDSVSYTSDGIYLNADGTITPYTGAIRNYYRSDFAGFINAAPNDWAVGDGPYFDSSGPSGTDIVWGSSPLILSPATNGIDTITSFSFNSDATTIDTAGCIIYETYDLSFALSIDTRAGLTELCTNYFGITCYTLISSRIDGEQDGDISLGIDQPQSIAQPSLMLVPNPTKELIAIQGLDRGDTGDFTIYDGFGRAVLHGSLPTASISVEGLLPGSYLVQVRLQDSTTTARFVKE